MSKPPLIRIRGIRVVQRGRHLVLDMEFSDALMTTVMREDLMDRMQNDEQCYLCFKTRNTKFSTVETNDY